MWRVLPIFCFAIYTREREPCYYYGLTTARDSITEGVAHFTCIAEILVQDMDIFSDLLSSNLPFPCRIAYYRPVLATI